MNTAKRILTLLLAAVTVTGVSAQEKKAYFVDGFHGGTYGHYPIKTYTKYMSDLLDQHPDWSICIEIEPETWDSVKVATPADYARWQQDCKTDRVEYTNPTYAQAYMYNIPGEAIIRQFEYGIKKLHQHFPDMKFYTYAVEEPCFTSCLPQILKGFGFKYASLKNPNTCWGGYYATVEGELVNWIGPDGSSVLCSPRYTFENLSKINVFSTLANNNGPEYLESAQKAGFKHPVGMTYQDAGWTMGPWLESNWRDFGGIQATKSTYTTWKNYFENIATDVTPVDYVSDQEDVRGALMWGTQVMTNIARTVRSAENQIIQAEKMGTIANIAQGYSYSQAAIDEGWRTLLLSQHHDSWIVPYNGLKKKGTWADWICGTWTGTTKSVAQQTITDAERSFIDIEAFRHRKHNEDDPVTLRIFNTAGEARTQTVCLDMQSANLADEIELTDAQGNAVDCSLALVGGTVKLLFKAEVPSFGFTTYRLLRTKSEEPAAAVAKARANVKSIENDMYKITFDAKKGGTIRSIIDKKNGGKELVSKGEYAFGEIKGNFYDLGGFRSTADSKATVTLIEDNEFEKTVQICGAIDIHPFCETITIREGDPKIDFSLRIDWQGNVGIGGYKQTDGYAKPERTFYDDRYHVNMYFPAAIGQADLYKSAPFDVLKSKLEDTNFHNWNDIKHNIILDWVSLEGKDEGFALLTDHTTSYVYGGGRPLALTVQDSGNGLWGRDYKIDGPTEMKFAIVPHQGGWAAAEEQYNQWSERLVCSMEPDAPAATASFLDAAGYEIAAAHLAADGILVRFYNNSLDEAVRNVKVAAGFNTAEEVDLNGNVLKTVKLDDGILPLSMPEFGFRTFIFKK